MLFYKYREKQRKNMNYRELQAKLRLAKENSLTTVRLNSKKTVLQAEYNRLAKEAYWDTIEENDITHNELGEEISKALELDKKCLEVYKSYKPESPFEDSTYFEEQKDYALKVLAGEKYNCYIFVDWDDERKKSLSFVDKKTFKITVISTKTSTLLEKIDNTFLVEQYFWCLKGHHSKYLVETEDLINRCFQNISSARERITIGENFALLEERNSIAIYDAKVMREGLMQRPIMSTENPELIAHIHELLETNSIDNMFCKLNVELAEYHLGLPWYLIEGLDKSELKLNKKPVKLFVEAIYNTCNKSKGLIASKESRRDMLDHVLKATNPYNNNVEFMKLKVLDIKDAWVMKLK